MAEASDDHIREIVRAVLNGRLEKMEERLATRLEKMASDMRAEMGQINDRLIDGNGTFGELRAGLDDLKRELTHQRTEIHSRLDRKAEGLSSLRVEVERNGKEIERLRLKPAGAAVTAAKSLVPTPWADRLERLPPWGQKVLYAVLFVAAVRVGAVDWADLERLVGLLQGLMGAK